MSINCVRIAAQSWTCVSIVYVSLRNVGHVYQLCTYRCAMLDMSINCLHIAAQCWTCVSTVYISLRNVAALNGV